MTGQRWIRLLVAAAAATIWYLGNGDRLTAGSRSPQADKTKTAEQVYKNIRVLNGLPASELDGVMEFMSASLGVGCSHCHSESWESDSKSTKHGTRRMILMTREINKGNFSSNPAITCYTCHNGQPRTTPLLPSDMTVWQKLNRESVSSQPMPSVSTDSIIDRYIAAIGGDAAITKIRTMVLRGAEMESALDNPAVTSPLEIHETAENKLRVDRSSSRKASLRVFDGQRGWIKDSRGLRGVTTNELALINRGADLFRYLKIKQNYPQMRVLAKESVGGRDAYVVGATSRDDSRERLYFDAQTGLLLRRQITFKTAFGGIPEITDFEDYREQNGVKLPFTIKWSRLPFGFVRKFSEIKINESVDPQKFQPPFR